jgi:glycerol-3-phosphate dehydrogenase
MAMTIEDVLARRTRLLFLDAHAAVDTAPMVAALMAKELLMDEDWQVSQVNEFKVLAAQYLLS